MDAEFDALREPNMLLLLCAFLVAASAPLAPADTDAGGEDHPQRAQVIAYAKRVSVRDLDAGLTEDESLERYLQRVLPADTRIRWTSSDCDLKPSSFPRPADHPLCATVHGYRGGQELRLHIRVGTHGAPITGVPAIVDSWLATWRPDNRDHPVEDTTFIDSLRALVGAFK